MKDKTYFIKQNYTHRDSEIYFNDTNLKDEWQDDVYKTAKRYFSDNNLSSVIDLGCGSGYKLIKYFDEEKTLGIDLPQTVEWLRKKYPDKNWCDKYTEVKTGYDLLICSDVIEHVLDPDIILDLIENSNPKFIVISTPDRDHGLNADGPPENLHHIREWNYQEFKNYISSRFEIIEHLNFSENTQCVVCKPRSKS